MACLSFNLLPLVNKLFRDNKIFYLLPLAIRGTFISAALFSKVFDGDISPDFATNVLFSRNRFSEALSLRKRHALSGFIFLKMENGRKTMAARQNFSPHFPVVLVFRDKRS